MAWTEKKELTEGQKRAAQYAGIPADRIGLGAEYPKAVYKKDDGDGADRTYLGKPLKIDGQFEVKTATVENEEEEAEALAQGWFLSPNLEAEQKKRDVMAEKDAELAELRKQLADKAGRETLKPKQEA